ncbi:MAG: hypothetical protein R2788_21185 [Saprospiraceae bacterium]
MVGNLPEAGEGGEDGDLVGGVASWSLMLRSLLWAADFTISAAARSFPHKQWPRSAAVNRGYFLLGAAHK